MRPSRAETDKHGNFRLGTYNKADGLPPGKYKIGIEKRQLVGELPPDYDPQAPNATRLTHQWITPKALANPETSGLEANVTQSGLEPAVFAVAPEVARGYARINALRDHPMHVSGAGSVLFDVYDSESDARVCARRLMEAGFAATVAPAPVTVV